MCLFLLRLCLPGLFLADCHGGQLVGLHGPLALMAFACPDTQDEAFGRCLHGRGDGKADPALRVRGALLEEVSALGIKHVNGSALGLCARAEGALGLNEAPVHKGKDVDPVGLDRAGQHEAEG